MSQKKLIIVGSIVGLFTPLFAFVHANIAKIPILRDASPFVVQLVIVLVGILSAAILTGIMLSGNKKANKDVAGAAGAAHVEEEVTDLDELMSEAEARLALAQQEKDAKPSNLPAIFLIGEPGSAKTTVMVHSDTEP